MSSFVYKTCGLSCKNRNMLLLRFFLRRSWLPTALSNNKIIGISSPASCYYKFSGYSTKVLHGSLKRGIFSKIQQKHDDKSDSGFDDTKAKIISQLNFKSTEDALPFYKLPVKSLLHIYKTTKNDEKRGYCKNRLYYIAHKIKCPPSVLNERLAKRIFVYSLSFEWLQNSLHVLLDMGVSGERIIRDLWVFKYHHETIRERLKRVKDMGIDNLYPWMVRCSEDILYRYVKISQDTKDILGDSKSTQIYLANRLKTSPEAIEDMCSKLPALKTIRVTKVKQFLDFLIEEGFEVEDIAIKPRILTASQKTVEQRLIKLRTFGLSKINLNILCRSKKDFKRYCESIQTVNDSNRHS